MRMTASWYKTARLRNAETGALRMMLRGHTNSVTTCSFSPDCEGAVTARSDRTSRLWTAQTGVLRMTLRGHTYVVTSCAFSPDGTRGVVTASRVSTTRL
jgi:WD40 repeat protein